nr:hypothetical protein CFP56_54797 [Quercus suber]
MYVQTYICFFLIVAEQIWINIGWMNKEPFQSMILEGFCVLSWLVVPSSIPFFLTNELLKEEFGEQNVEYLLNNYISCICTKKSENISIT